MEIEERSNLRFDAELEGKVNRHLEKMGFII